MTDIIRFFLGRIFFFKFFWNVFCIVLRCFDVRDVLDEDGWGDFLSLLFLLYFGYFIFDVNGLVLVFICLDFLVFGNFILDVDGWVFVFVCLYFLVRYGFFLYGDDLVFLFICIDVFVVCFVRLLRMYYCLVVLFEWYIKRFSKFLFIGMFLRFFFCIFVTIYLRKSVCKIEVFGFMLFFIINVGSGFLIVFLWKGALFFFRNILFVGLLSLVTVGFSFLMNIFNRC